jgi:maleylacetoacetate isomerase
MNETRKLRLWSYWRSSASYRVRIALNLKGLPYETLPVHLVRGGGEQHQPAYLAVNPQARVPALDAGGGVVTQSLAIIEYLEEAHPRPALLPADPVARARVRSLALTIACDIQPLQNIAVTQYLKTMLRADDAAITAWLHEWIGRGLAAVEALLARDPESGRFCQGDSPSLADACLVPQCYAARRVGLDLGPYPTVARIDDACRELEAFRRAAPEAQPNADA